MGILGNRGGLFGTGFQKYEAPIDLKRPALLNRDKTISTERTITVGIPGGYAIIPTIVDGIERSPDEAIQLWRAGRNQHVGMFPQLPEAEAYATQRSALIGRVRR